MKHYSNDPRMIKAKFASNCSKCGVRISKGSDIYYWPSDRKVYCLKCGEAPFREFRSSVADEEVYAGTGNPYYG